MSFSDDGIDRAPSVEEDYEAVQEYGCPNCDYPMRKCEPDDPFYLICDRCGEEIDLSFDPSEDFE
jgi:hypothetical protein